MTLATGADAPSIERDGFVFRPLAVPSRGSAQLAIWTTDVPPGAVSEPHSMDHEEVIYVLEGTVAATIGGGQITAARGDAIIVPPDTLFELRNAAADAPARILAATSVHMKAVIDGAVFAPPWLS